MAYDKVVDSSVLNAGLTKIADAIRAKGGTSGQLAFPDGMAAAIEAIETGGGGSGGVQPATLTINSESYTKDKYATVFWLKPDGTIGNIFPNNAFTFPLTLNTVVNSGVVIVQSNFGGIPDLANGSNCIYNKYGAVFYIVPTATNASVSFIDND